MTWHVTTAVVERYLGGTLDRAAAASVETHVTGCPACRSLLPDDPTWVASSWNDVLSLAVAPTPGLIEQTFRRCGVPEHLARVIVTPVVARRAWLFATALAFIFAVFASRFDAGTTSQIWLLVTAPLAPVAGVALTFARRWSSVHDLELAAPFDTLRLLLIRSSTVTGVALVMAAIADLAAPSGGLAAAWLVPALALVVTTLALGTWFALPLAAFATSLGWLTMIGVTTVSGDALLAFGATGQGGHLVVLLLAILVLAKRSRAFDPGVLR